MTSIMKQVVILFYLISISVVASAQSSAKDDFKKGVEAINQQNGSLAISWIEKGLEKVLKGEAVDESTLLDAKAGRATAYFLTGKTLKAQNIIEPLLGDIERVKGRFSVENMAANYLLALSFQLSGQYQQAAKYYETTVAIQDKVITEKFNQRAQLLKNLSSVYQQLGNYQKALQSEENALKLLLKDKPNNIDTIIVTYSRLAFLADLSGNNAAVLDFLNQQYAQQSSVYGESHRETKRMLAYLEQVVNNNKNLLSGNDLNRLAGYNLNVFDVDQLGSPDQAEVFYNNIFEQYGDKHPLTLKALARLADSLSFSAQYARAIPLYTQLITEHIRQFPLANADRAGFYLRLSQAYEFANTYGVTDKYRQKAIANARKAIEIYVEIYGEAHLRTIIALNQLWRLTRFSNQDDHSSFILANRIWHAYTELERNVLPYMNKQQRIGFRQNFSELKDNFLEAAWSIDRKRLFNNAFKTNKFWDKSDEYSKKINKASSWREIQVLWESREKELKKAARDDEEVRQQRNAISQKIIRQLYDEWLRYKGGVSALDNALTIARAGSDNKQGEDIDRLKQLLKQQAEVFVQDKKYDASGLQQKIQQLTQALSKTIPSLRLESQLSTDALVKSLDNNTVFIDFARYLNSEYMVFVIEPDGQLHIQRLTGGLEAGDKINKTIRKLRSRIDDIIDGNIPFRGSEKKLNVSLQKLYDAIILPIEDIVNKYGTIVSSPDGLLSLLPLTMLKDKRNGQYLIERFLVRTIPSAREWLRLQLSLPNRSASNDTVIYANPDFNAGSDVDLTACASQYPNRSARDVLMKTFKQDCIHALPATAKEASAIAALFPGSEVYTKSNASEKHFLSLSSPRILHLATHGFFIPDPAISNPLEKSGIILSGANTSLSQGKTEGIVTGLKLATLNLYDTELVVLSACETGVGDIQAGEGIAGLNQAFIRAGAKGVVMSLWRVPDEATSRLMTSLYKIMSEGAKPVAALRVAQRQFIKQKLHPLSWAAFVYNG